jgi:phasin family protein
VKSVQEALEVQTNLTKEATERQMAEAKKIADASGALVQEVIKPLSDRAKAAMEKVSQ